MNSEMIRRLVYAFKRQWGREVSYVQIDSAEANGRTGERTIQRQIFEFVAVRLPETALRKFIQDIGYLAANKNFTYGALNDFSKISFLVSADDFPETFNPNLNGWINFEGKRYERVSIENLFDTAYLIVAQGVSGASPYQVLNVYAESRLQVAGRAVHELN